MPKKVIAEKVPTPAQVPIPVSTTEEAAPLKGIFTKYTKSTIFFFFFLNVVIKCVVSICILVCLLYVMICLSRVFLSKLKCVTVS